MYFILPYPISAKNLAMLGIADYQDSNKAFVWLVTNLGTVIENIHTPTMGGFWYEPSHPTISLKISLSSYLPLKILA